MPLIPQDFIDQVITSNDLVQLIGKHVKLKRVGRNYTGLCPFHQEKSPSFNVSAHKQVYHCFGCQAGGNALNFVMQYSGKSLPDAVAELAQHVGMALPQPKKNKRHKNSPDQHIDPKQKLYDLLHQVQMFYVDRLDDQKSQSAKRYLFSRGINEQTMKDFGLGYAPDSWDTLLNHFGKAHHAELVQLGLIISKQNSANYYDRFRNRIIFPIADERSRILGFGGRALSNDQKPKYLNSPESDVFLKSEILYGLNQARKKHKPLESLIVVEGYMDLISMAQYGITNVVACMGTAITAQHLQKLFSQCDEVIFAFDGDQAGQQAAMRTLHLCLPILRDQLSVGFLFLPEGEDPDTLLGKRGKNYFNKLLTEAPLLTDVFFKQLKDNHDLKSYESKVKLAYQTMPEIQTIPGKLIREAFYKQFSELTGIKSLAWGKLPDQSFNMPFNTLSSRPFSALNQQQSHRTRNKNPSAIYKPGSHKSASTTESSNKISPALPGALRTIVALWYRDPDLIAQIPPAIMTGLKAVSIPEHSFLLELAKLIKAETYEPAYLIGHWHNTPFASIVLSAFENPLDMLDLDQNTQAIESDAQENIAIMQSCLTRLVEKSIQKELAMLTKNLDEEKNQQKHRQLNKIWMDIAGLS